MTFNFCSPSKYGTSGEEEEEKDKGPRPELKPPPKTCDEWLSSSSAAGHLVSTDGTLFIPSKDNEVIKWPIHPPHLDFLVAAPQMPDEDGRTVRAIRKHESPGDTILGSVDEIKEDLRKHARNCPVCRVCNP